MDNKTTKAMLIANTFKGFLAGFILLVISFLSDMIFKGLSFVEVFRYEFSSIPHIIIYLLPFFLAYFNYSQVKFFASQFQYFKDLLNDEYIQNNKIIRFINDIKQGNTNNKYEIKDAQDEIGKSLNELQANIKKNQEEEHARKKEDVQRTWVNEGLAKFGDILRNEGNNIESLSFNILSNMVSYLNANQGGLFILHEENSGERYFDLTASYAYERKKFADKRVEWGEGFIGAVGLEKESIYLEDVPETYVTITSGLGKATPTSLLIVPLKINNEIHGVIEIASFHKFEQFQIEFVEKVAENTASTLASVKINAKTARLLVESQTQAVSLANKEEQMRVNMEELQAAQEEAARQSEKFIAFTNTVNHTLIRAEYSIDGVLLYANTNFLKKLGYKGNAEVEGQHISMFISPRDKDWFFKIWDNLSKGGKHFEGNMKHVTKQNADLWTMATYTCMRRSDGSIEKILFLGLDITEQKEQSLNYEGQIEALNRSSIKAEFSVEGEFMDCNKHFLDAFEYSLISEIDDKKILDFIDRMEHDSFKKNWQKIIHGHVYQGVINVVTKENSTKWCRVSFSASKNMYDEIEKIILIAQDVSSEKTMEMEMQKQNEQLRIQEEKLRNSEIELSRKLEKAMKEMMLQFQEIEKIKELNILTLEGALDAIITIDKDGVVSFFNKAAEELWGYSKDEVVNKNVSILFDEKTVLNDKFVANFVTPSSATIVGERREIAIKSKSGNSSQVLMLISDAQVENDHTYTGFIQKIEVELF